MNLLQPFCVDITALYHCDAIYSLTVPPCDSTILYPGFDQNFMSRILGRKIWVRGRGIKGSSMLNDVNLNEYTHRLFCSIRRYVQCINNTMITRHRRHTHTHSDSKERQRENLCRKLKIFFQLSVSFNLLKGRLNFN